MWKKLLKYDFRSLRRFGLPILIVILAAGLLGAVSIVGIIWSLRVNTVLTSLLTTVFALMISFVFLVISIAVTGIGVASIISL